MAHVCRPCSPAKVWARPERRTQGLPRGSGSTSTSSQPIPWELLVASEIQRPRERIRGVDLEPVEGRLVLEPYARLWVTDL